jgi:hypothetical protein
VLPDGIGAPAILARAGTDVVVYFGVSVTAKNTQRTNEHEPIGIVISRGRADVSEPRFAAYVWGESDETELSEEDAKAA